MAVNKETMIHIVTHCYAGIYNHYAGMLRYHLSSVRLYSGLMPVAVTIVCERNDSETIRVLEQFENDGADWLSVLYLPLNQLGRRCIGRNIVAKKTDAPLVWFSDVDYVFGPGCLESVWRAWENRPKGTLMIFPEKVLIHTDHQTGDRYAQEALSSDSTSLQVDPRDFRVKRYHRAIGGVQIVAGTWCRKWGYLDGNARWQRPCPDDQPFGNFGDDLRFRACVERAGTITRTDKITSLYRLRHTRTTYR